MCERDPPSHRSRSSVGAVSEFGCIVSGVSIGLNLSGAVGVLEVLSLDLDMNMSGILEGKSWHISDKFILIEYLIIPELLGEVEGLDVFGGAEGEGSCLGRGELFRGNVDEGRSLRHC